VVLICFEDTCKVLSLLFFPLVVDGGGSAGTPKAVANKSRHVELIISNFTSQIVSL